MMNTAGLKQKCLFLGVGIFFVIGIIAGTEVMLRILYRNNGDNELRNQSDEEFFNHFYVEIHDRFFKKVKEGRKRVYITQRKHQEGVPVQRFSVHKGKNTLRIFLVGGSVAEGYDIDYLQKRFGEFLPNTHLEILNCGVNAYDSYRVSLIVKEILNYDPDLIIVMSGNNEFFTPSRLNVNIHLYRLSRFLSKRMVLFRYLKNKYINHIQGIGGFNEDKKSRLREYKQNITQIIERAKKKKVPLVVCTLPANFRDCPPEDIPAWEEKHFLHSWGLYLNGSHYKAINSLNKFLRKHPEDAFAHFYLARYYEKVNDFTRAKFHYLKALDYDAKPGCRCPTFRNSTIRTLCKQHNMILVDLAKVFQNLAPHNLVGITFFKDSSHWWPYYYDLLSWEIVKNVVDYSKKHPDLMNDFLVDSFPDNSLEKKSFPLKDLGQEETIQLFAYAAMFFYEKVFLQQDNIQYFDEYTLSFLEQSYKIESSIFSSIADIDKLKGTIEEGLKADPNPPSPSLFELSQSLYENFWSILFLHVAEILRKNGQFYEALEFANEALKCDSPWNFGYLCRGLIYASLGLDEKAELDFEKADILLPENYWVNSRNHLIIFPR